MKKISALLLLVGLVALAAGCGDDDDSGESPSAVASKEDAAMGKDDAAMENVHEAQAQEDGAMAKGGTALVLGDSDFGEMVYDDDQQAIYVFERDTSEESTCYGECAAAWPPVLTKGKPVAGNGLDQSLLGTTERRDGSTQVTYDGRPLYYYVDEGPGEVLCHNVNLNGGFWWVIGADGEPLA